jgi:hypothetical protein
VVTDPLFKQLMDASTLSPIFAKTALHRALVRSGVKDPEQVTKEQLKTALPEVLKTLKSFLGDGADAIYPKIEALTR